MIFEIAIDRLKMKEEGNIQVRLTKIEAKCKPFFVICLVMNKNDQDNKKTFCKQINWII